METTLAASTILDLLQPAAPRCAHFHRDTPPPIRLSADDLAVIRHVAKHRFLRSTHLIALLDRPAKKLLKRLAALYHNAYLDRPRTQLDYFGTAGSAPIVYVLGNKGAAILAEFDGMKRAAILRKPAVVVVAHRSVRKAYRDSGCSRMSRCNAHISVPLIGCTLGVPFFKRRT